MGVYFLLSSHPNPGPLNTVTNHLQKSNHPHTRSVALSARQSTSLVYGVVALHTVSPDPRDACGYSL